MYVYCVLYVQTTKNDNGTMGGTVQYIYIQYGYTGSNKFIIPTVQYCTVLMSSLLYSTVLYRVPGYSVCSVLLYPGIQRVP